MRKSPEHYVLRLLFECLHESGIRYAVLRNFENLPDNVQGGDLDILVHPDDREIALEIISAAIQQAGGAIIGRTRSPGFHQIIAFGQACSKPSIWWGLCLDIFDEVLYRGAIPLLSTNVWVDGREGRGQIQVLNPGLAAVLGVLKEIIHNSKIMSRYQEDAVKALNGQFGEILRWMAPLGTDGLEQLKNILLNNSSSTVKIIGSRELRFCLIRKSIRNSPAQFIRSSFAFYMSRVKRLWKPAGLVVAMLGTDGAGKSTIIATLDPVLSAATHRSFIIKHLRPELLPPLARFKSLRPQKVGPVTNPHGSSQSGMLGSLMRIVYLTADYILGYWFVVWPKIAKVPSSVVLFDRYAYDMALDQKRFRINLPRKLVTWFISLVPKPDIIFCLYASPLVVFSRKQELPLEEIVNQIALLKEFCAKESRAVLICNDGTVEETRDRVLIALREFCIYRGFDLLHSARR